MYSAARRLAVGSAVLLAVLLLLLIGLASQPVAVADATEQALTVVRELTEKRTATSTTYLLSDGSRRALLYETPVHYRDAKGAWQDLDTSLAPTSVFGAVTSSATPATVTLGAQSAGAAPVAIAYEDARVGFDLLGAVEPAPLVLADEATYLGVAAATDLRYRVLPDGLKETLVLASAAAPGSFTFFASHEGLLLQQDPEGEWGFYRAGEKAPVFVLGDLVVFDSSRSKAGEPAECAAATMAVAAAKGGSYVTYTVPRPWLAAPERVFPVTVDPTITLGQSVCDDTYVSSAYPSTSYGSADELKTGYYDASTGWNRSLLRFDTGAVADTYVTDAHLRAYQWWQYYPSTAMTTHVGRVTEYWGEGSTWDSLDDDGGLEWTGLDAVSVARGQWLDLPCRTLTQRWASGEPGYMNHGFAIYQNSGEGQTYWRKFRSSEWGTSTERPRMVVDYEQPQATVSAPAVGSSVRVGDWVTVTVNISGTANKGSITEVRMGVNRAGGPNERTHGVMGWFRAKPASPWWPVQNASGGWFAYYYDPTDPTAYGSDHMTPDLANCTIDSASAPSTVTFRFQVNDNWGDVQDNDFDTYFAMDSGTTTWDSKWVARDRNVDVQPVPLAAAPTYSATPSGWFTETDANNDGLADNVCDVNAQGRGSVTLSWTGCSVASGYSIWLFDGNTYRKVGTSSTTSWTSSGKGIYPSDTQIAALTANYASDPFKAGSGLDLRDNPNALYAKTTGTSYDARCDYAFKVVPTNSHSLPNPSPSANDPVAAVTLDNRSRHVREAPRHTTYDLGAWAEHELTVLLDAQRFRLTTTDLEIASWGPCAALGRTYSPVSRPGTARYAPGWWFSFQRCLTAVPSGASLDACTQVDYWDEGGEALRFAKSGTSWLAPNGLVAALAKGTSTWTLTLKDKSVLTFDSSGRLTKEADASGNEVLYAWSGTNPASITAANGQVIALTCNAAGQLTQAVYATADGTRQVNYAQPTGSPAYWEVTAYPGATCERKLRYFYDAQSRLTKMSVVDWDRAGHTASEEFLYGTSPSPDLTVRFADWDATAKPDARAEILYSTGGVARVTRYGTVLDVAGTAVHEDYSLNPTGTTAWRHNPTSANDSSGEGELWRYEYSPGNQVTRAQNPLGDAARNVYDARGNLLLEADELGNATTYVYTNDLCTSEVSPLGSTTTRGYDAYGNLTWEEQVLNAAAEKARSEWTYADVTVGGRTYRKALTQERQKLTATDWATTQYSDFAANGLPQTTTHPGVLLSASQSANLTELAQYDAFGNTVRLVDATGAVTDLNTCDLVGQVLTAANPDGSTTRRTYDRLGSETESWRTRAGSTTRADDVRVVRDACGRVVQEDTLLDDGQALTAVSTTLRTWDGRGRLVGGDCSTVSGVLSKSVYDAQGDEVKHWAEGVNPSQYLASDADTASYDALRRETQSKDGGGGESVGTTYYANGCVASETSDLGVTTYAYDAGGNVVRETSSDGEILTTLCDLDGRETAKTSSLTDVGYEATYDLSGEILETYSVIDGISYVDYQSERNQLGWALEESSAADGTSTTITYDEAGRPLTLVDTDGSQSFVYNDAGDVTHEASTSNATLDSVVDPLGRLSQRTAEFPSGLQNSTTYAYDSLGREVAKTDTLMGVSRSYEYPASGPRVETVTWGAGPVHATSTRVLSNAAGRVSQRITTLNDAQPAATLTYTVQATDALGFATDADLQLANGYALDARWSYVGEGRLQRQWGAGFAAAAATTDACTYEPATDLKASENYQLAYGGALTGAYTYDSEDRVSVATIGGASYTHNFDASGRLASIAKTTGGTTTTTTFTYGGSGYLISSAVGGQTTSYEWDTVNGRRTWQGAAADPHRIAYSYDADGRLTSYADTSRGLSATYTYAGGRLQGANVAAAGLTTSTSYVFDHSNLVRVAATPSAGSSWTIEYLYNEDTARPYAGTYRAGSASPVPFAMVMTERGDVVELLDAQGTAFAAYRYDPWGNSTGITTRATAVLSSALAAQIVERQGLRFRTLLLLDAGSGLHCGNGVVFYDAKTCQYLTGPADGVLYGDGNPLWEVDLTVRTETGAPEPEAASAGDPLLKGAFEDMDKPPKRTWIEDWPEQSEARGFYNYDRWPNPSGDDSEVNHAVVFIAYSHSPGWNCSSLWEKLTAKAYDTEKFFYDEDASLAYMRVRDHSANYVDTSKGCRWQIPTDGDGHSFIHIRAYGRYHGDDNFYIHRPATATRSQLRYVPATCHLDVNHGHRWEFLRGIGVPVPSSLPDKYKVGGYDGNAENCQTRIGKMWRAWGFSFGSRANLHNEVHGFRKIDRDWRGRMDRVSITFRWHRSDGWATTLRM